MTTSGLHKNTLQYQSKRYFKIDQNLPRLFCTSVNTFSTTLPYYATLFLLQGSEQITIKGCDFSHSCNAYTC